MPFETPYDRRVITVRDALLENSALDADTANSLAVHVLQVLANIPEKIR